MSTSRHDHSKVGLRGLRAAALLAMGLAMAAPTGQLVPAAQAQAPAPSFSLENNALKLPSPIVFEFDSDKLSPQSDAALNHIKAYLEAKSYITLMRIEGHTDNKGSPAVLQRLTEKRATAVGRWLVAHGIDCKRLIAVGFGSNKPIADNGTPDGRAQNRRITVSNAALRGHLIGGMPADGGGQPASDDLCKK